MTKLEEKLLQLGYDKIDSVTYEKHFIEPYIDICIEVLPPWHKGECICEAYVCDSFSLISTQEQLDDLQQAFNQLQSDLKELKEYE